MREFEQMDEATKLVGKAHREIAKMIKPGITTMEINELVEQFIHEHGATAEQKGFQGYPYATCASINDEICRGFPRNERLEDGDIVTIDMVVNFKGGLADSAWTYAAGNVDEAGKRLMEVTKKACNHGIEEAHDGNRGGDMGHRSQTKG